jgi:hypothetical protein
LSPASSWTAWAGVSFAAFDTPPAFTDFSKEVLRRSPTRRRNIVEDPVHSTLDVTLWTFV